MVCCYTFIRYSYYDVMKPMPYDDIACFFFIVEKLYSIVFTFKKINK